MPLSGCRLRRFAAGAHSLHEWRANRDGHPGIQKALLLVLAEAGFPPVN